jgi:aryl-alcohol dehydrogenase-like predicted oxidoreductase
MKIKHSRREFLASSGQWAATAGLLTKLAPSLLAQPRHPQAEAKVISRALGRTGLTVPIVSLGFMNADAPGLVRRAYEVGIRHVDTAAAYQRGRNEEIVGSMIKDMGVRSDVIVSTKVWLRDQVRAPNARDLFRQALEGSLKRLQMDHVDILYYHLVDSLDDLMAEGPLQSLAELKKEGKARSIGLSTHRGSLVLPAAAKMGLFDVGLAALNYTMASDQDLLDALESAARAGMGIIAMKTQAGGLSRPDPALPKNLPLHSQTALLKWVLHHPFVATAIPGATTYEQVDQNFSVASNLEYTDDERAFLADRTFSAQAQFCRQCAQCLSDCPRSADIPTLMRSHMYAVQYSDRELARFTLSSIEAGRGLDLCRSCGECPVACRHNVNIGMKIAHLRTTGLDIIEV